jgi:hypothetical protein
MIKATEAALRNWHSYYLDTEELEGHLRRILAEDGDGEKELVCKPAWFRLKTKSIKIPPP